MKKLLFFIVLIVFIQENSFGKIRRVGFFASPISGTDYTSFALAYAAAANDDTILMFPNTTVSGTLNKKLRIFGPGNFLDPNSTPKGNANLQAFPGEAFISSLTIAIGSEGSLISGFRNGTIYVTTNDITIQRNRDITVYIAFNNPAATVTNLQVLQNFFVTVLNYYTNSSSVTNLNISNNFINYFSTASGNTYSGNISNNVWAYDATQTTAINGGAGTISNTSGIELGGGAYLLQNNIFVSYTNAVAGSNYNYFSFSNGGNSVFNYNLALQASSGGAQTWGAGVGNVITAIGNASSIFKAFPILGTSSVDSRYQLATGSPALTVGLGSTAIGMFTGTSPYKLSTIPTIPTIYSLTSPQGNNPPGTTIQINLSTRGNN